MARSRRRYADGMSSQPSVTGPSVRHPVERMALPFFVKMMLGRDTGITLQNEAESHTTAVKPLSGDAITLLAFSTGSSVFLVPGGNLRSPRGMGTWAIYTTGCLSSPSSRHRLLATWGAAEETSWCFYSVCDSESDILTGADPRSHSIQLC